MSNNPITTKEPQKRRNIRVVAVAVKSIVGFTVGSIVGFIILLLITGNSLTSKKSANNPVEAFIGNNSFMQTLKTHEPELYQKFSIDLATASKQHGTADLSKSLLIAMEKVMLKRMATASNDAVYHFTQQLLSAVAELRNQSGELCYAFLFPHTQKKMLRASTRLSQGTQKKLLVAMEKIIIEQGATPVALDKVLPDLVAIHTRLAKHYGADVSVMESPETTTLPKQRVCDIFYSFYEEMLKLPPEKVADIMRTLSAQI